MMLSSQVSSTVFPRSGYVALVFVLVARTVQGWVCIFCPCKIAIDFDGALAVTESSTVRQTIKTASKLRWFDSKYRFASPRLAHAAIEPTNQNRWLLVEFIPAVTTTATPAPVRTSDQAISGKDVFNALKQSVLVNFGDTGWGDVGGSLAGASLPSVSRKPHETLSARSQVLFTHDAPLYHTCRTGRSSAYDLGGSCAPRQNRK